ncbi:ATP-dependent RNA helicase DDX27, partial [Phenoliferia sp. Uapishka_3]
MADFIMTLSSDDEAPQQKQTPKTAQPKAGAKKQKLSRKEQLKQAKGLKKQKRKRVDSASEGEEEEDDGGMAGPPSGDEEQVMAEDFHFDGLGGGFVGERRQYVWDAGQSYIAARPNAIPRVTVDEIIARRDPERTAKSAARALRRAAAEKEAAGEGGDEDELELEMLNELEGDNEDDDEDEDEEENSEEESEDEKVVEDVVRDDDEDWLKLDELSDGEEEPDVPATVTVEPKEAPAEEDEDAPTGFAALAGMDDELSESDEEDDDTPVDLQVRVTSPTNADPAAAAEAAAAKAYFTSHTNVSNTAVASTFSTLPNCTLSRQLLLSLGSLNLTIPTPIQRECIPVAMLGKDIVASSRTGSGKTVAFWVGVIERLLHRDRRNPTTRVVVMTPTRELAVQVHGVGVALARYTDVQFCLCVGGLSLKTQEAELKLRPDVVVSTPGRLIDHVRNTPCFNMDGVEVLVLDEADRMLEEGFRAELEEIISAAPRSRQTLLFSATVTESVSQLSRLSMNHPVRVKIDELGATAEGLVQEFLRVRGDKAGEAIERGFRSGERSREALLVSLCTRSFASGRTIIFFRSKAQAHRMKIIFTLHGEGLERSDELHGDLTQEQRLASLRRFREGECAFLLATDLASRGLDIKGIENVINYEMPRSIEIYLHRVGRTARAGKKGRALTLVGESDRKLVKLAMKHAPPESIKQRVIPPEVITEVTAELQELEGEVKAVQREEKEEKEFRRGDMEVTKGRNLIQHELEIKSRPARTWFQTEAEKKTAKSAGLAEHNSKFSEKVVREKRPATDDGYVAKPPKRTPFSGMSRKEKRRKMAADEDREDREEGNRVNLDASFRAAKKATRPTKMTVAPPPRDPDAKRPKKKKANVFDREIGQAGKAEKRMGPASPRKKSEKGGSAGKGKSAFGNKRAGKAGKRS